MLPTMELGIIVFCRTSSVGGRRRRCHKMDAGSIQSASRDSLAFASRTRLPVKVLKCAWFDEKDYFEFFPLQAVRAKSRSHSEEAVGWSGSLEASGSPSIP